MTVCHLRAEQIVYRAYKWFRWPSLISKGNPDVRPTRDAWVDSLSKNASYVSSTALRFLNETRVLHEGNVWTHPNASALWRYQLHYFDDLNAGGSESREDWHRGLIANWIAENPRGAEIAWDSYPISLRVVNWIKWHLRGHLLDRSALESLYMQVAYLRRRLEYHLLGNHLLENAKALVFAGSFFAGRRPDAWFEKGMKLLRRELAEQILTDGGHFELSPMYHAIVLEGVLDLINLGRVFRRHELSQLEVLVQPMLTWLECMTHPDGNIALFNDSAIGQAGTYRDLLQYGQRLGLGATTERTKPLHVMPASGYARVSFETVDAFLDIGQIGPAYQPGHAHADTLGFELSVDGERLLVDSGVSLYETSEERSRQRSTASHNCIVLNGESSSDVWSAFRVGRRARVFARSWRSEHQSVVVEAAHDGYAHMSGKPVHKRRWHFSRGKMDLRDEITGSGSHTVLSSFHFHPAVSARFLQERLVLLVRNGTKVGQILLPRELVWELEETSYHPAFGVAMPSNKLVGRGRIDLPSCIEITLQIT
jgi:uncharacterized heparinase superfamily protein